jgi:PAS domain-containing protein
MRPCNGSDSAKDSEAALRESVSRYRELFGRLPPDRVAVYEAVNNGVDLVVREWKPAAERIGGVSSAEVFRRRVTDVYSGVVDLGPLRLLRRVWRTGVPERLSAALYVDLQRRARRENSAYTLPTDEIVAVYQDVSERRQTGAAIQAASVYARS